MDKELQELLFKFELDPNQQSVYISLLSGGSLGATEISKRTNIAKTTVYRILDELKLKKLVTEGLEEYRRVFEPEPIQNLKFQLVEKQTQLKSLEDTLPIVIEKLSAFGQSSIKKSQIKYYSGIDGLKQVTWNSSKTKGIFRIFELEDMSAFLRYDFAEQMRSEFVKNKVITHEITNEAIFPEWTDVHEIVEKYWITRYIDPKEFKMEFEMLVYNDVFTMYNYEDDEIFCVEIYNEKLARTQKQVFDFIWNQGKEMEVLTDKGATRVKA
jgi:sugar-specific transcriptional regulator TrmB